MPHTPAPPPANQGWIGGIEEVLNFLSVVGADQDDKGVYKVYTYMDGRGPSSFMGLGDEIVLHGTEEYSVDGHRSNLAAGLRETSYGLSVMVL